MNYKMRFGIAMVLMTSLSVAILGIPSKGAIAQISPENQTMSTLGSTEMVPIDTQIRDLVRSNHPLLAALADKIPTMDASETLRYTVGVEIIADLLRLHAMELSINQTGSQSAIPLGP
jgi:hypothetical protein